MATNNQDNDLAFLDKKDANALSLKDIYFTVMRHIHWILLGALIGGIIAYYRSDRSDRIYESHARIKINAVTRNWTTARPCWRISPTGASPSP